jgi:hypothetical protein
MGMNQSGGVTGLLGLRAEGHGITPGIGYIRPYPAHTSPGNAFAQCYWQRIERR